MGYYAAKKWYQFRHNYLGITAVFLWASFAIAQPSHTRLIYSHSLLNGTPTAGETIVNSGGAYIAGKGWQASTSASQLTITLAEPLPYEGTFVIDVTNFDPASQYVEDLKLHIINLYSRVYYNNKDIFYTDGSWCNIRTGIAYSTNPGVTAGFKFLAAARGIDTRDEQRCIEDHTWNLADIHQFKITWTRSSIYCSMDGVVYSTLPFSGQIEPFKYLLIGKDNLIWGYAAQPGVIYGNLRIYGRQNPTIQARSRIFLQGAYNTATHTMSTTLRANNLLPLQSPYPEAPYTATSIPTNIVDWLLLNVRRTPTSTSQGACSVWLRNDGQLINPQTGGEVLQIPIDSGDYYLVVQHRNHLAAMSSSRYLFDGINSKTHDFTTGLDKYYNNCGALAVETGIWAVHGGDMDADKSIASGDYNLWLNNARDGEDGYVLSDINLDGYSTSRDYVLWFNNAHLGAGSGLP
ncbi:hypothetical protein JXO59_07175 [candidate division KSB1 bacterium]|nr:hypothetical protein [candidate division KSB1 bacterium]